MIRTQVRCDKRVSFRDRREGWTCVCPSPGVARTHMATRTVSLRAGNPRQAWTRPSPTAPMRWRVLRSTNAGCNHTGLSGGSRPQHQAATTHKRPMLHTPLRHRRTLGKITKPRHHRRRPTISYIIVSDSRKTWTVSADIFVPSGTRMSAHPCLNARIEQRLASDVGSPGYCTTPT